MQAETTGTIVQFLAPNKSAVTVGQVGLAILDVYIGLSAICWQTAPLSCSKYVQRPQQPTQGQQYGTSGRHETHGVLIICLVKGLVCLVLQPLALIKP